MAEQLEPVITLPNAQEIMERLKKVDDDTRLAEEFYPLVAQAAGRELVADGVVMMLAFKINDFISAGYQPIMGLILHKKAPSFIDALIDNKEVAEKAKAYHQELMDAVKKE